MLQIPQNTGMSESMGSIADSVPKISNMLISADKCMVVPDKIHISISEPITIKSPKVVTDDTPLKATKSESAEKIKDKENDKKLSDAAKRRHKMMGGWFKEMGTSLKKGLTDNPIVNFIKDHWGKIMIAAMAIFLSPAQWKTIWKGIKSLAHWAITDGVTILKGIFKVLDEYVPKLFDVFVEVVKFFGVLIDNVFGKRDKDADGNEIGNRKGGLFGEGETGPLGIITGVLSGLALLTTGIGALGLLIAPGSTLLLGFAALKGLLKAPFNLIPKLPGISGATSTAAGRVGPTVANAAKLGSAGAGKSILSMIGPSIAGIVAAVAIAFAAYKAGTWLNDNFIKPWVDKNNKKKDEEAAVERKGDISRREQIMSLGARGNVLAKDSLSQRMDKDLKGKKGAWNKWGGTVKPMTLEEVKEKYAPQIAAEKRNRNEKKAKDRGLMSRNDFLQSEQYKGQMRENGVVGGQSTGAQTKTYEKYLEEGKPTPAVKESSLGSIPVADSGPEEKPATTKGAAKATSWIKKLSSGGRQTKYSAMKKYVRDMKHNIPANERAEIIKAVENDTGLEPKTKRKFLKKLVAADKVAKNMEKPSSQSFTAEMKSAINAPQPIVSPTMKADTLNQVQGENSNLKSGETVVAPITNINNYYNSSGGGGEGGTAIYGVPTAQQGKQHRHSNIR